MKIENIIWDWNGTIVDDAWVFVEVMNDLLKKHNLRTISVSDYKKNFCFPIEDYWRFLGFRFSKTEFNALNQGFIKKYQKKMFLPKIHNGLKGVLKKINSTKIQQFVLSASEQGLLNKSVNHYRVSSFFKGVYGVDNLNAKGKLDLGKSLMLRFKLNPKKTLLIGDTLYDKDVAVGLGCNLLLVSYGHINHMRLMGNDDDIVSDIESLARFILQSTD